jgi:hypothetical protein
MTITRVGATKQYSDNWENIFGGSRVSATKKQVAKSSKPSSKRASVKKKTRARAEQRARTRK